MKTFIALVLRFLSLVICWPLALIAIFVFPLFWLLLLPFRIIGFSIELIFRFIGALLMFPFRVLGVKA